MDRAMTKADRLLESINDLDLVPRGFFDIFNKKLIASRVKLLQDSTNKHLHILNSHPAIKGREQIVKVFPLSTFYHRRNRKETDIGIRLRNSTIIPQFLEVWVRVLNPEKHKDDILSATFVVSKNNMADKWEGKLSDIYVAKKYQKQGIAEKYISFYRKVLEDLEDVEQTIIAAVDIGTYAWSRIDGVSFANDKEHKKTYQGFQTWCKATQKSCKIDSRNPSAYPKEYLLSDYAPKWIKYIIT